MAAWKMALAVAAAALPGAATAMDHTSSIDAAARAAMVQTSAKGLAVALIDRGKVALVRSYGLRNAAGAPLQTDTVMYGASLTKAMFAYAVMQMVDDGRVRLDTPIADWLPKPLPDYGNLDASGNWGDLAGDERWLRLTPRLILEHATGFANYSFLEPDGKLRFHFDPGARYAYSGEGILLLQFGLEHGFGFDMGQEMQRRVFDRLGMRQTSAKWRPDFAANLADGWTEEGKPVPHDERSRVRLSGSVDTTIADVARFAAALVRGDGLSARTRAEMVRPQIAINTARQFPTLQADAPVEKRFPIAAGLGVVTFSGPQGPGFFKGGHDEQTANLMVCIEREQKCAVILSNDVRAERAYPALIHAMIGETAMPWRWEYGDAAP